MTAVIKTSKNKTTYAKENKKK